MWDDDDKAIGLITSLRGVTAEIIQIIPEGKRTEFAAIMDTLEKKNMEVSHLELSSRCQKLNERIQDYATEIERLANLAYIGVPDDVLERLKINAFLKGLRDAELKKAVWTSPKTTFMETLGFALTQEAASVLWTSSMKVSSENDISDVVCVAVRQILRENKRMPASKTCKCYACQKPGHFARKYRSKHKGSHSTRNISEGASEISNKQCVKNENKGDVVICRTIVESNGNFSKEDMRSVQMADEDLNAILKAIEKEGRPTWEEISRESPITKAYWAQWQSLIVEDGCLWRIWHSEDASWAKKLLCSVISQHSKDEFPLFYDHQFHLKIFQRHKVNAFYAAISEYRLPNRIDVFSTELSDVISAMTYALELPECQANVEILWIPSHIGIDEDERANEIAKRALYQSQDSELSCRSPTITTPCRPTKGVINLDH
uniref:CCHC-type domain-containing protein n=1 Tax=Glossina austeni TaxID=7395 RepID=A0A1A9V2V7_GLOAU